MKRILVLFCAGVLAWSSAIEMAWARDCYNARPLVREGKKLSIEPVCKAMTANLNKFCDQPPMVCGLKIHPSYRHLFSLPDWKPMPPDMAEIEAFIRTPWMREDIKDRDWADESPKIAVALSESRLRFGTAEVDIYSLGKKEPTYRLDLGDCATKNPQVAHPAEQKTWNWPIQWFSLRIQVSSEVLARLRQHYAPIHAPIYKDLFSFRGATYAYSVGGNMNPATGEADNTFHIDRYERSIVGKGTGLVMQNVCEIEYHPTIGESR